MKTTEVIDFMRKGAPGALILMRPGDLKGFAEEVRRECAKELPEARPVLSKTRLRRERAEIVQAVKAMWPDVKVHKLAEALCVTRQCIYKWLITQTPGAADGSSCAGEPEAALPDIFANETLAEAAKRLTGK